MKIHKSSLPKQLLKKIDKTEFDEDGFLHGYLMIDNKYPEQCFISSWSQSPLFEFGFPIFNKITHLIMITVVPIVIGYDINGAKLFIQHELRFHF